MERVVVSAKRASARRRGSAKGERRSAPASEFLDHVPQAEYYAVHELCLLVKREPRPRFPTLPAPPLVSRRVPLSDEDAPRHARPFPRREAGPIGGGGNAVPNAVAADWRRWGDGCGKGGAVDVGEGGGARAGAFAGKVGVVDAGAVAVEDVEPVVGGQCQRRAGNRS